jgi:hypothetical protein
VPEVETCRLLEIRCGSDANKVAIAAAGGIAPLEQLARDGEGNAKTWASDALAKVRRGRRARAKKSDPLWFCCGLLDIVD